MPTPSQLCPFLLPLFGLTDIFISTFLFSPVLFFSVLCYFIIFFTSFFFPSTFLLLSTVCFFSTYSCHFISDFLYLMLSLLKLSSLFSRSLIIHCYTTKRFIKISVVSPRMRDYLKINGSLLCLSDKNKI